LSVVCGAAIGLIVGDRAAMSTETIKAGEAASFCNTATKFGAGLHARRPSATIKAARVAARAAAPNAAIRHPSSRR
jgi:hypothetical protein